MRPVVVTVGDEIGKQALQMAFVDHDVRERLTQLLRDPTGGRVFGHADVEYRAPGVMDHGEDVEDAEGRGRDGREVHGVVRQRIHVGMARHGRPEWWQPTADYG